MKRFWMLILLVGGIMAGPVLADVEDGVTAVAEASVNQYKTAILLIAGAGWDAATDLDLEEVSDQVKLVKRYPVYTQHSESAAADTDAAALLNFSKTDTNTDAMVAVRVAFFKKSDVDKLVLRARALKWPGTAVVATISLKCGGLTATFTDLETIVTAFELELDISSLGDNTQYEVTITLEWATADGGTHTLWLYGPSVWADVTTAP